MGWNTGADCRVRRNRTRSMARDSQFMPRQARPNKAHLRAQLLFQHAPIDACQTDPGCMIIHDRPATRMRAHAAVRGVLRWSLTLARWVHTE